MHLQVEVFLRKFQWDTARYQFSGRPLAEIVAQIQSMTAKVRKAVLAVAVPTLNRSPRLTACVSPCATSRLTRAGGRRAQEARRAVQ